MLFGTTFSEAGVATSLYDISKPVIKSFKDDGIKIAEKQFAKGTLEKAVAKYGDEAGYFLSKAGPNGVEFLERYNNEILGWFKMHGDDVVKLINRPSFESELVPLIRKYGPEVISLEKRAPGMSSTLLKTYGNEVMVYTANLSANNIKRMAQYGHSLKKIGQAEKFGELSKKFGDELFKTIDRALGIVNNNPTGSAITFGFLYTLVHPETMDSFLKALAEIPGDIAHEISQAFKNIVTDPPGVFPVRYLILIISVCGTILIYCMFKFYVTGCRKHQQVSTLTN